MQKITNEDIVKYIEIIAGKPSQITHPVIKTISSKCLSILPDLNKVLSTEESPWEPFTKLETSTEQLMFIKAAASFFPEKIFALTNLVTVKPPLNIHLMQRKDPYWVGDFFSANMVIHSLNYLEINEHPISILDIGCSSGSLVRVLAAYDTSLKLFGCDPVESSINWAIDNINTCSFKLMFINKPLPYDSNSMDGITAISVWSHHRPDAAKRWIDEVLRILKPGGFFILTFSTLHHVRWMAKQNSSNTKYLLKILKACGESGNFFIPINYTGEDNETDIDWGQSCYSRECFFSMFYNKFDVAAYFPGLNQGNQDLAVFIKK